MISVISLGHYGVRKGIRCERPQISDSNSSERAAEGPWTGRFAESAQRIALKAQNKGPCNAPQERRYPEASGTCVQLEAKASTRAGRSREALEGQESLTPEVRVVLD